MIRSWAFQAMVGYGLLAAACLWAGYYIPGVGSLAACLLVFQHLRSYLLVRPSLADNDKGFKIVHFNVLKTNQHFAPILETAALEDADFLSFQEVTAEWGSALKDRFARSYPYFKIVPLETSYGMAVFSKRPLEDLQVFQWSGIPNFAGCIDLNGTRFHFLTAHSRSPVPQEDYHKRNDHLKQMTKHLAKQSGPRILIGDFNTVPWDQALLELRSATGLQDSRKSFAPTYRFKKIPFLYLPIDYILHSQELECLRFKVIRKSSSDHMGIAGIYQSKKYNEKL